MAFDLKKILEHELVPKHEVLEKKQVEELLQKCGARLDDFPRIGQNDPVVQVLRAKRMDVLKITRRSLTAGEAVYYRIVY